MENSNTPPERTPVAVESVEQLSEIYSKNCVKVVHATLDSCKACGRLKREIGPELDVDVEWVSVSVDDVEGAQEQMNCSALPRIDIVSAHGTVTALSGFDCTREAVLEAVKRAKSHVLVLDEDF